MNWILSHRFDPSTKRLADKHYNRQTPDSPQFAPPGRCLVMRTRDVSAFWITSWPEYAQHAWEGAWVCSAFRNESSSVLSSVLIREAVSVTRFKWPDVPSLGMITFVDASEIRHKRDPGRCFLKAGFRRVGMTGSGKITLQLLPEEMPEPEPCDEMQFNLI